MRSLDPGARVRLQPLTGDAPDRLGSPRQINDPRPWKIGDPEDLFECLADLPKPRLALAQRLLGELQLGDLAGNHQESVRAAVGIGERHEAGQVPLKLALQRDRRLDVDGSAGAPDFLVHRQRGGSRRRIEERQDVGADELFTGERRRDAVAFADLEVAAHGQDDVRDCARPGAAAGSCRSATSWETRAAPRRPRPDRPAPEEHGLSRTRHGIAAFPTERRFARQLRRKVDVADELRPGPADEGAGRADEQAARGGFA